MLFTLFLLLPLRPRILSSKTNKKARKHLTSQFISKELQPVLGIQPILPNLICFLINYGINNSHFISSWKHVFFQLFQIQPEHTINVSVYS